MKNSENSEEHWRNEEQDIMMSCSSDANLFFNHDLSDPKDWTRLIKTIERIVRTSAEYRCWARWAKETKNSENCEVCEIEFIYSPVETHHYPKNLFSIVEDVLQQHLHELDKFRIVQLADMVNVEHLKNKVSFVN